MSSYSTGILKARVTVRRRGPLARKAVGFALRWPHLDRPLAGMCIANSRIHSRHPRGEKASWRHSDGDEVVPSEVVVPVPGMPIEIVKVNGKSEDEAWWRSRNFECYEGGEWDLPLLNEITPSCHQ